MKKNNFKMLLIIVGFVVGVFALFSIADILKSFDFKTFNLLKLFGSLLYPTIGILIAAVAIYIGQNYK